MVKFSADGTAVEIDEYSFIKEAKMIDDFFWNKVDPMLEKMGFYDIFEEQS